LPQGTLSERMRCAAAGLGGYYSPVSVGTRLAEGKEHREIDGRMYVLEKPLKGDVALLAADRADRWGNLTYRKSARNFNPTMAMAADLAIVQVRRVVELGELDPEMIVTPGIFVDRVVQVALGIHSEAPRQRGPNLYQTKVHYLAPPAGRGRKPRIGGFRVRGKRPPRYTASAPHPALSPQAGRGRGRRGSTELPN